MKAKDRAGRPRRRTRRSPPNAETLSMDWFTPDPVIHEVVHDAPPLNNPSGGRRGSIRTSIGIFVDEPLPPPPPRKLDSVDNSKYRGKLPADVVDSFSSYEDTLAPDPRGCHSNLAEHKHAVDNCARTLRKWGVSNPYRLVENWTTDEILTAMDELVGLEREGYQVDKVGGWLWHKLSGRRKAGL